MIAPRQPDPVRSAGIRAMLVESVDRSVARRPARRAVMFASIAAVAALIVGGVGITISRLDSAPTPGHGVVVAPTDQPSSPYSDIPVPTGGPTDGTGYLQGAGTESPDPIAPDPGDVDLSDPSTWKVTFEGIGPIVLGVDQAKQEKLMTAFRRGTDSQNSCGVQYFIGADFPGMSMTHTSPDLTVSAVAVNGQDGNTLPGAAQLAASPKTESGIGVGSTLGEVRAAYPSASDTGPGPLGENYGITDGHGNWIVFAVSPSGVVVLVSVADGPDGQAGMPEYCG